MQAVILVGIQASGKSTFCRSRFFDTHLRLNLDMLRTRHRERLLLEACLVAKQRFVVDNTNPTPEDRQRYIEPARAAGFDLIGYHFNVDVETALRLNEGRPENERVPRVAIYSTQAKLDPPTFAEGFCELYTVRIDEENGFIVERQERPSEDDMCE